MAKKHAKLGYISGPVHSADCSPTGGASIDDPEIRSMVFECFVSTHKNSDGTSTGYYYNARVNWDDGTFTYGIGRANE